LFILFQYKETPRVFWSRILLIPTPVSQDHVDY